MAREIHIQKVNSIANPIGGRKFSHYRVTELFKYFFPLCAFLSTVADSLSQSGALTASLRY